MAVWMQSVSPTSSYDMRVACVLQDGAIIVHSLTQDYRPIADFDTPFYPHGHDANIKCIAYSNMYQLIVTSTDGTLSVFKMGSSGVVDVIPSWSRDSDVFKALSNDNGLWLLEQRHRKLAILHSPYPKQACTSATCMRRPCELCIIPYGCLICEPRQFGNWCIWWKWEETLISGTLHVRLAVLFWITWPLIFR